METSTMIALRLIDPSKLSDIERGKLLNGLVVPRPIAVVSSISSEGHTNIAPFSYFNVVGEEPMALSFSITAPKPDGSEKDTLRNVRPPEEGGTGEFVVNIATSTYAREISLCGASLPYGVSEFGHAGLTPVESQAVKPPRIGESPAWFECRTAKIVPFGRSHLVIGQVVMMGVRSDLIDDRYRTNVDALESIARLAGSGYCRIGYRFNL